MRYSNEHWRDFGHANITEREAEKQSSAAIREHEQAGLGEVPQRHYFSHWLPWDQCDAEAFAAAGIGLTT
jgi:hypothetical protein